LPQIEERVLRLKEIGQVLNSGLLRVRLILSFFVSSLSEFGGSAEQMVMHACGSAVKLVELIIRYFPGMLFVHSLCRMT
jgi:hypothetical protein